MSGLTWITVNQHLTLSEAFGKYDYRIRRSNPGMFVVIEEDRVSRQTRSEDCAGLAEGQSIAEQWACERQKT